MRWIFSLSARFSLFPESLPRVRGGVLCLVAALVAGLGSPVRAQVPVPEKPEVRNFRLLIEPRFQSPPVWELLAGAKETGVSVGVIGKNGEPRFVTPEEMKIVGTSLAKVRQDALGHVEKLLAETKPRRVLAPDGKSSTHCIYHGKNPLLAGIVLTPKLLERHKEEYGERLLAVIPDRYTVVIIRPDAEILEARSELLTSIFDQSVYPISLEVLQIDASGIRVIGNLGNE